jgi:hypothetical protein
MVAVHARPGKVTDLGIRELFSVGNLVKTHPGEGAFLVRLVRPYGNIVFGGTGDHACPAPGALVQIDDHAILVPGFSVVTFFFHELPHSNLVLFMGSRFKGSEVSRFNAGFNGSDIQYPDSNIQDRGFRITP